MALLQNLGVNKIVAAVSGPSVVDAAVAGVPGIDVLIVLTELFGNNLTEATSGPYPTVVEVPWGQPVLVVASGTYGKYLGRLDVEFNANGVITSWSGQSLLLSNATPIDLVMHAASCSASPR